MNLKNTFCFAQLSVIAMAIAACATTSPAVKPAASNAPEKVVATQPATVAAAAKTTTEQDQVPSGFKRVVRGGEERFCQTRSPTGSRARNVELCYTRDEIKKMEESNQDFMRGASEGSSHATMPTDSPN